MATLDIVIVNWNSGDYLQRCLISIEKSQKTGFCLNRVVIIDNGSTDDSMLGVTALNLPLVFLSNIQNRGFAYACNQGAQGSCADYLLFLNPDVELGSDSLLKTIEFMENPRYAAVGICGIKLVDETGCATISAARFPTPWVLIGKITGLAGLLPGLFPPHIMTPAELSYSRPVDQVIGAFFLIRRAVYEACAGFDERFFLYFEEVDLSLRAKNFGYNSYYLADVTAFHHGGGSSEQIKATRLFYSLRSRLLYQSKHFRLPENITLITLMFTVEFVARLWIALRRLSWLSVRETVAGYTMLVRYFRLKGQIYDNR